MIVLDQRRRTKVRKKKHWCRKYDRFDSKFGGIRMGFAEKTNDEGHDFVIRREITFREAVEFVYCPFCGEKLDG